MKIDNCQKRCILHQKGEEMANYLAFSNKKEKEKESRIKV